MPGGSTGTTRSSTADGPWLDPAERAAWVPLAILLQTLPGELDAHLQREAGLTFFEYSVLAALSERPGRTVRMSELARMAHGSPSRLSHAAAKLERRGLLRRELSHDDGRYTNAILTDEGWDRVRAAAPMHVAHVRRLVIDTMTSAQLAHLRVAASRVIDRLNITTTFPGESSGSR